MLFLVIIKVARLISVYISLSVREIVRRDILSYIRRITSKDYSFKYFKRVSNRDILRISENILFFLSDYILSVI